MPIAPLRVEVRGLRPGRSRRAARGDPHDRRRRAADHGERVAAWRPRADRRSRRGLAWRSRGRCRAPSEARREAVLRHGPGRRLPHGDGVPVRRRARSPSSGPALVWMRMRQPLVEGEEPSPLQRVLVAADSGNGVSATLDWSRYLFINVDLSVHLHRMPEGEWVCLDAVTMPEPARGRARRQRRCTTSAGRSAAPCRRCSSASAEAPPERSGRGGTLRCDGERDQDRARGRSRRGSQRPAAAARCRGRPRGRRRGRRRRAPRCSSCAAISPTS